MELYDPTVTGPERNYSRAPPLATLEGLTIGLLANGKVNADVLLEETAAIFVERHGCRLANMVHKGNASAPAGDKKLTALVGQCDFMMTAMGD